MKTFPITLCLICFLSIANGQFDANRSKVFTSLKEALKEESHRVFQLDLQGQNLKTFPEVILKFENLTYLNLADNQIKTLDNLGLVNFKKLKELVLFDNQLESFPYDFLKNSPHLLLLDVSENRITSIDSRINQLRFLEYFNVSGNNVSQYDADIKLPFLKTLKTERNRLKKIPDFVLNSSKLMQLNIYGNLITSIPNELNSLDKLRYLNIGDNPLVSIDHHIALRKLRVLILDWINLSKDKLALTFIKNSPYLESLSMENCQLSQIPKEVFSLYGLHELSVLNNNLTSINLDIISNKKLKKCWLGGNRINESQIAEVKKRMKKTTFLN